MVKTKISNYSRPISEGFDFSAPDYGYAITRRHFMVKWMRSGTKEERRDKLASLYRAYRANPAQMIEDWGCTYDPRNAGQLDENDEAIPTIMPFVLFPKQKEWVDWAVDRWLNKQEGVTEKSRDMGVSWLAVALSCCLCVLYPEMAIGFGSRKEDYVDKAGFPRSLFFKGRLFMDNMPLEFSAGWSRKTDAHMRLTFPATKSVITGEAGDSIGRGDRTGLYFTDEDAQIEHPDSVDASLSATTDCRIRVSSANGTANSFYLKRQQYVGKEQLFTLHWRDNPLKSQEWYDRKAAEVNNPVVMAQEYDINYSASVEGVLIPSSWVNAAMDAHKKLGFGFDGERWGALDVADTGRDKNAFCGAHGVSSNTWKTGAVRQPI
jgi:phage terminase large subunit